MKITRLPIDKFPLLASVERYLLSLPPPLPPFESIGSVAADINDGPPDANRTRPRAMLRKVFNPPRDLELPPDVALASLNYYPAGGGMGWHTDSAAPGWRIYIGRVLGDVPGIFLHLDERETIATPDEAGLATAFFVSGLPGQSWHALHTLAPRLSIGLRLSVTNGPTAQALGLAL